MTLRCFIALLAGMVGLAAVAQPRPRRHAAPATTQAGTEPTALLTIPHILQTPLIAGFHISPSGDRVGLDISVLGKEAIWMVQLDDDGEPRGPGAPIETERGWRERDLNWAPDGRSIAFASHRDGSGTWHVYIAAPDGTQARRLTTGAQEERSPRWSPDGKRVAFLAREAGSDTGWDLWFASGEEDAPTEPRQLTGEPFDEEDPQWAPDGTRLAVSLNRGSHRDSSVGIVSLPSPSSSETDDENGAESISGRLQTLTPEGWEADTFGARWSPDGSQLAFVSDEPGLKSIFLVSASPAGGGFASPRRFRDAEFEQYAPAWHPDGTHIAYLENRDGDVKLRISELETGQDRLMTLRNGVHTAPEWFPAGAGPGDGGAAVASLFEAWNYPRDVWAYPVEGGRSRVSDTLPPELDVRKLVRPELVRYSSFDGRDVTGYLYLPEDASAASPARLLVRPHGGPTSQWQNSWHPFVQLLVQRGFAVFAPNVRGSSGYGVAFENLNDGDWGRGDLDDLIAGTRFVSSRPEIRDDRIGIWGVSYGGFLTLAAITRYPDVFACAVEAVGMPDLEALYRQTNDEGRNYLEREIGPLRGHLQLYRDLSPLAKVADVKTPLLSFHGEIYPLVPYSTKEPFLAELRKRPTFPLLDFVFKGEEVRATYRHDLHPEAAWAYVEKIMEFLDIYL